MVYERLYLCVFALSTLLHDGITSNLYNTLHITQVWKNKRGYLLVNRLPSVVCIMWSCIMFEGNMCLIVRLQYCILKVLQRCAGISFKFCLPLDGLYYFESWSCIVYVIIFAHFVEAKNTSCGTTYCAAKIVAVLCAMQRIIIFI